MVAVAVVVAAAAAPTVALGDATVDVVANVLAVPEAAAAALVLAAV